MTKIIGLTGGIGSGKTTIANYFHSLGIPIYIADDEARKITELPQTISKIKQEFGGQIFENGKLNRQKLAELVFNDSDKLQKLNAIVHPAVAKHFKEWLQQHSNEPIIIKEAAILFESGSYKDCDAIITVTAPIETRIGRVLKRDKTTRNEILKRIENQWSEEKKIANSDYVIDNAELKKAEFQAREILKKLIIS
jgi:dephospho-CoA kinase